jgi:myo-inositol-1(or 4)-monophosphatase
VRTKGPRDIVTGTDLAAQAVMERLLRSAFPDHDFVGEEGEASAPAQTARYWLVDPLCGTTNYAAGLPMVAVNVALVEDTHVTVGVVGDPASGDVYVAERRRGAWLDGGAALKVSDRTGLVSVDPTLGPKGRGLAVELALGVIAAKRWTIRALGTTLVMAHVAAGRIAAAVYARGASPVHLAAGLLLAEEAGAIVTDTQGRPWLLDSPAFVIAATPSLHQELLEVTTNLRP